MGASEEGTVQCSRYPFRQCHLYCNTLYARQWSHGYPCGENLKTHLGGAGLRLCWLGFTILLPCKVRQGFIFRLKLTFTSRQIHGHRASMKLRLLAAYR